MKFYGVLFVTAFFLTGCTSSVQPEPTQNLVDKAQHMSHSMDHAVVLTSEKDFLVQMIAHHVEAIDSSMMVATQTSNSELNTLAVDIISAQQKEVDQMKKWLQEWYGEEYVANPIYQPMMGELTHLKDAEFEKAYIQGMIIHHQGAIDMARQVKNLEPHAEVSEMADAIIKVQQEEVNQLEQWLTKYSATSSAQHSEMSH